MLWSSCARHVLVPGLHDRQSPRSGGPMFRGTTSSQALESAVLRFATLRQGQRLPAEAMETSAKFVTTW